MIVDFRIRLPLEHWPAHIRDGFTDHYPQYDSVLGVSASLQRTEADLLAELEAAGVEHAVVHAEHEFGDIADELNESVAAFAAAAPAHRTGFGTVSLGQGDVTRMVRQVRRCHALGLKGINIQPAFFGRSIDDRELFAVYSVADELGLVVAIHTGVNYDRTSPMMGEHPMLLDRVACAFPGLRLVACHAAWPWVAELAAVVRRHPTVSFDFGGMSPRYLRRPDSGWATLMSLIDNMLSQNCLFATDWPVFSHDRALAEWEDIELKDSTRRQLLGENAMRLLQLKALVP